MCWSPIFVRVMSPKNIDMRTRPLTKRAPSKRNERRRVCVRALDYASEPHSLFNSPQRQRIRAISHVDSQSLCLFEDIFERSLHDSSETFINLVLCPVVAHPALGPFEVANRHSSSI